MFGKVWNKIKNFFNTVSQSPEERYLSQAIDVADLEVRLRNLQTGSLYERDKRFWQYPI